MEEKIIFDNQIMNYFSKISHDVNPVHINDEFARKTSYGQRIVYGILGSFACLGKVKNRDDYFLSQLSIEFRNPMFIDIPYDLKVFEKDQQCVVIELLENDKVLTKIEAVFKKRSGQKITLDSYEQKEAAVKKEPALYTIDDFTGKTVSLTGTYEIDRNGLHELKKEYCVSDCVLTPLVIDTLMLSTYLVGMEIPGQNAVFSRLKVTFDDLFSETHQNIEYTADVTSFNENYALLTAGITLSSQGRGVAKGEYVSFVQKDISPVDIAAIDTLLDKSGKDLSGKSALVTGGSRGLGAVTVKALVLRGCHVYLNYYKSTKEAQDIEKECADLPGSITLVQGDAGDIQWCKDVKKLILNEQGKLDYLFCNAATLPQLIRLSESAIPQIQSYIDKNLALTTVPLNIFIDTLSESRGTVIAISSIFIDDVPRDLPQYVSLKYALEGLIKSTARSYKKVSFLVVRPPRMLTDMNNTPLHFVETLAPEVVAADIVNHLTGASIEPGFYVLDDFKPAKTTSQEETAELTRETGDITPELEKEKKVQEKEVQKEEDKEKIVIAGTFTTDKIVESLSFWKEKFEYSFETVLAPYNQVFQELLNPDSNFALNRKGLNVILLCFEDWIRYSAQKSDTLETSPDSHYIDHLKTAMEDFLHALNGFSRRTFSQNLVILCPSSPFFIENPQWNSLFKDLQEKLTSFIDTLSGFEWISATEGDIQFKIDDIYDSIMHKLGHVPYKPEFYNVLGTLIFRRYFNLKNKPYKVIVLDCDNTLWKGVCGEVGPLGVSIDGPFLEFQKFIVSQYEKGILLCLNSKNNEEDVWNVFEQQESMPLKKDYIVDTRINWNPKSENLRHLAKTLNLGLDSFIFIDDNPVECNEVRSNCPEVLTIQWPEVDDIRLFLEHMWIFDHYTVTGEDKKRTQMYQSEVKRKEVQANSNDYEKFIQSLEINLQIESLQEKNLPRVSQLTQRTNQFNFTTIRRHENDIKELIDAGTHKCLTVQVSDRFGDYGIVGVVIIWYDEEQVVVDTFLLSCRVLGRGIEHRILSEISKLAKEHEKSYVKLLFRQTAKNTPAKLFLESIEGGYKTLDKDDSFEYVVPAEILENFTYKPSRTEDDSFKEVQGIKKDLVSVGSVRDIEKQLVTIATDFSDVKKLTGAINSSKASRGPTQEARITSAGENEKGKNLYTLVLDELKDLFSNYLFINKSSLEEDEELETYGLDSYGIIEISAQLCSQIKEIPHTLLFEHRTFSSIVEYLLKNFGKFYADKYGISNYVYKSKAERKLEPGGQTAVYQAKSDAAAYVQKRVIRSAVKKQDTPADIAIIGISGRFPNSPTIEDFWEQLKEGKSCISEIPKDRWDIESFFDPSGKSRDKSYSKWGGFLQNINVFDSNFFNISPREAALMDPQQRLFLEIVQNLLDDAGYFQKTLDRNAGVFVGVIAGDFGNYVNNAALTGTSDYRWTDYYQIPNRVSYFYDLHGPSIAIDSACSSSGTAIHYACESIIKGECPVAIAGGVNLFIHPSRYIQYSQMQILSKDDKCRPFGDNANGTVYGEGVGAVLLKSLDQAERDNDTIYGVIKATAVNSGGKTNGFTVPNPHAHSALISKALKKANIDARTISYIEAHGTGTSLGDPIEIRGLTEAFANNVHIDRYKNDVQYCSVGSIKANIGHLESAAAMAALIKVLYQMKKKMLVPSLNSEKLNPLIPFDKTPFYVQQKYESWDRPVLKIDGKTVEIPRRSGLSFFGAGGSNAHIIVEEYDGAEKIEKNEPEDTHLFIFSARSEQALKDTMSDISDFVRHSIKSGNRDREICPANIAYTLQAGRAQYEHRAAFEASSLEEIVEKISGYLSSSSDTDVVSKHVEKQGQVKIDFGVSDIDNEYLIKLHHAKRFNIISFFWISGITIDWNMFYTDTRVRKISMPGYHFSGKNYPIKFEAKETMPVITYNNTHHPLYNPVYSPDITGLVYQVYINLKRFPYLDDHRVHSDLIVPGSFYLAFTATAVFNELTYKSVVLKDITFRQAIMLKDEETYNAQVIFKDSETGDKQFQLIGAKVDRGINNEDWLPRMMGIYEEGSGVTGTFDFDLVKKRCVNILDSNDFYKVAHGKEFNYGPDFQCVQKVWMREGEALVKLYHPPGLTERSETYTIHPALLDACLQPYLVILREDSVQNKTGDAYIPFSIEQYKIYDNASEIVWTHVVLREGDSANKESFAIDVTMIHEDGTIFAEIECLRLRRVPLKRFKDLSISGGKDDFDFLYKPSWILNNIDAKVIHNEPEGTTLIISDGNDDWEIGRLLKEKGKNNKVITVNLSSEFSIQSGDTIDIDYSKKENYEEIVTRFSDVRKIYFLSGLGKHIFDLSNLEELEKSQQIAVYSLLRFIQAYLKNNDNNIILTLLTRDSQLLTDQDELLVPYTGSLIGFAKVIATENPSIKVNCIDLSQKDLEKISGDHQVRTRILNQIIYEDSANELTETAVRSQIRYKKILRKTSHILTGSDSKIKKEGTYFIIGGAGGIGFELSLYLAEHYKASLVLTGRKALNKEIEDKLKKIEKAGGKPIYCQADATVYTDMEEAVKKAKNTFESINGVFHSAIVLKDSSIINIDENTFRMAFDPKVKSNIIIYELVKNEPLDFICFFSSECSFRASAGQSNYVAGSRFTDTYAHYLSREKGVNAKVINWGYWGDVGIVSSEKFRAILAKIGILPIKTADGLNIIEHFTGSSIVQLAAIKQNELYKKSVLIDDELVISQNSEVTGSVSAAVLKDLNAFRNAYSTEVINNYVTDMTELIEVTSYILIEILKEMGMSLEDRNEYTAETLMVRLGVDSRFKRLIDALVDILTDDTFIQSGETGFTLLDKTSSADTNKAVSQIKGRLESIAAKSNALHSWVKLLDTSWKGYKDILTGKVPATDILFPQGSNELVAGIYNDNPLSDYFNLLIAEYVYSYIAEKVRSGETDRTIRIFEFGAGTGSTSSIVLERIKEFSDYIEYTYSDVSPHFTLLAKERYGTKYPFIRYGTYDLDKEPEAQKYSLSSFDLIFGTNAVHIAKDLSGTLLRLKKMLRKNGVLLLNELTDSHAPLTVTFGLLDGWWRYEDPDLRLYHSPLLSIGNWKTILSVLGFKKVTNLGLPDTITEGTSLQQILAMENDGELLINGKLEQKEVKKVIPQKEEKPRPEEKTAIALEGEITLETIKQSSPQQRKELLYTVVREQIKNILQYDSIDEVGINQSFSDMGVDSLIAIRFRDDLSKFLSISLPSTIVFDYPSIEVLVNYLNDEVFKELDSDTIKSEQSGPGPQSDDDISEISEEQAEDELLKELEALEKSRGEDSL